MRTATRRFWPALCLGLLTLFSCQDEVLDAIDELNLLEADQIVFVEPDLFPEGIEYDLLSNRFLVSSLTRGSIGTVAADGSYADWITTTDLPSTIGIHVDIARQRLLIAVADPGVGKNSSAGTVRKLAGLAAYSLLTKKRIFYTRLDALAPDRPHFANDVTVDPRSGHAYVTDSFSGIIYRVDTRGNASIFLDDSALSPPPGGFGLNGIDFVAGDNSDFLLVNKSDERKIIRVPIDNPTAYQPVSTAASLQGNDGLTMLDNQTALVVNNASGGPNGNVTTLVSTDMWQTATLANVFPVPSVFPTTVAVVPGNDPFVLHAFLHVLFSGGSQASFQIERVDLDTGGGL